MSAAEKLKVLGFVGSLRAASLNADLFQVAGALLPRDAEMTRWNSLAELPHYSEDLDVAGAEPPAAIDLRSAVDGAAALVFVTPEYNGGVPSALKNVVDWISRPAGAGAVKGKPVAVIGASTGGFGGVWAQAELRKSLGIAGARVLDTEFAVPRAAEAFESRDSTITLADGEMGDRLRDLLEALVAEGRFDARVELGRRVDSSGIEASMRAA